ERLAEACRLHDGLRRRHVGDRALEVPLVDALPGIRGGLARRRGRFEHGLGDVAPAHGESALAVAANASVEQERDPAPCTLLGSSIRTSTLVPRPARHTRAPRPARVVPMYCIRCRSGLRFAAAQPRRPAVTVNLAGDDATKARPRVSGDERYLARS